MRQFAKIVLILSFFSASCETLSNSDDYSLGSRALNRAFQIPSSREVQCSDAKKMLVPLAENGDCDAQYKVGLMYFAGVCYENNNAKALEYFNKSAKQGHVQSSIMLGDLYLQKFDDASVSSCESCGIKKDLYASLKWYKLAEKNGTGLEKNYLEKRYQDIGLEFYKNNRTNVEMEVLKFNYSPKKCEQRLQYRTLER